MGLLKRAFQYEIYCLDRDMSGAFNKGRDYLSSLSYGSSSMGVSLKGPWFEEPPNMWVLCFLGDGSQVVVSRVCRVRASHSRFTPGISPTLENRSFKFQAFFNRKP